MSLYNPKVGVTTQCPYCGSIHKMADNEEDYWNKRSLDTFPYLSVAEQEMLLWGICPQCWDKYFGSDEEPEPDYVNIHGNTFGGDK